MDGAQDYDIVMLKTDYIKSVKVIKKGKMDEIVLPSVPYHLISRKEVDDLCSTHSKKAMEEEVRNRKIPKTSPYGNYVFAYLSKLYLFFLAAQF